MITMILNNEEKKVFTFKNKNSEHAILQNLFGYIVYY